MLEEEQAAQQQVQWCARMAGGASSYSGTSYVFLN